MRNHQLQYVCMYGVCNHSLHVQLAHLWVAAVIIYWVQRTDTHKSPRARPCLQGYPACRYQSTSKYGVQSMYVHTDNTNPADIWGLFHMVAWRLLPNNQDMSEVSVPIVPRGIYRHFPARQSSIAPPRTIEFELANRLLKCLRSFRSALQCIACCRLLSVHPLCVFRTCVLCTAPEVCRIVVANSAL